MKLTLTDQQARRVGALLSSVPPTTKKQTGAAPTCERCGDPLTRKQKRFCTRECFNPRPAIAAESFESEAWAALSAYRAHFAGVGQSR